MPHSDLDFLLKLRKKSRSICFACLVCVGSSGVAEQVCQTRSARILMTGPACTYTFVHGSALHMSNATCNRLFKKNEKKQCKTWYIYTSVYNMVYITILLYYYITILLYYYNTILLYYYLTILLYYYITILLYYYINH